MSKLDPVKLNPAFDHHKSHGLGEHAQGHAVKGNIARDGAPKRVHDIKVHGGMVKHTADGSYRAFGGDHASAIDSLSGVTVPPARNTAAAGWGNEGIQSGHPLAKAPGTKNVKAAPVHPSMSRGADNAQLHELGRAIMDEAFAASAPDDRHAHGRKRDCPNA